MHRRAQFFVKVGEKSRVIERRRRLHALEHPAHHRMALLGAADGFHHIAEVRRMHVAEITQAAPVIPFR